MKVALLALLIVQQRPATCTPGLAFWDTQVKVLYRCSAPNVWTPYYAPKGVNLPPIPPDPTPQPPVNKPPTLTMTFDPALPPGNVIAVKNQKILLKMTDDAGVVWTELYRNAQKVWEGDETTQKTYTWNTQPYKKKGAVTWRAVTRDAEGLTATAEKTVTVK
jgi:hypothetical protein